MDGDSGNTDSDSDGDGGGVDVRVDECDYEGSYMDWDGENNYGELLYSVSMWN